jgi:hypothetical protein
MCLRGGTRCTIDDAVVTTSAGGEPALRLAIRANAAHRAAAIAGLGLTLS